MDAFKFVLNAVLKNVDILIKIKLIKSVDFVDYYNL